MRSPNAWYCDLCGSSWEECAVPTANQSSSTWAQPNKKQREKSQKQRRPRSRKKNHQWEQQAPYGQSSSWGGGPWSTTYVTDKGQGKGAQQMQVASPPPPPPPMLAPGPAQCHAPWMPQQMPQQMPHMNMMPFMPPQLDQQVMQTVPQQSSMMTPDLEDYKAETSAQTKLNKIMKAAKKEEHLSPEFQSLVATERKKDDKESTSNLVAAVKAHGKAKEALMEVENSRMQLWSQWRVFLQASVTKWKEYTSQFQASETAFQHQMQAATLHLKKAQKRVDLAKKRADALGKEDETLEISDDDMGENEADLPEEEELPRDENAQRIQEGLNQVVTSLSSLSESADKLEPKSKRPRTREEEDAPPGSKAMQPFHKADAS